MIMFCNYCGKKLSVGDDAVEFLGEVYCDEECLDNAVEDDATWIVIDEED